MIARDQRWRPVSHPLALCLRKPGWKAGRHCLISPRGTVFQLVFRRTGVYARKRPDFQLNEP